MKTLSDATELIDGLLGKGLPELFTANYKSRRNLISGTKEKKEKLWGAGGAHSKETA